MGIKRGLSRADNSLRYEFQNAYFKVVKAELNTERNRVIIQVKAYPDEASRRYVETVQTSPMPGMYNRTVYEKTYDIDASELPASTTATTVKNKLLQSSYLWLKQSSGDFNTGIDVLEEGQ